MASKTPSNIVFVNQDKKNRAEDIYRVLTGKRAQEKTSPEHELYLKERHGELLKEAEVDLKDHDASVVQIYKNLGGAIRTVEQAKRIKDAVLKSKSSAKALKEDQEGTDADEAEEDDDE